MILSVIEIIIGIFLPWLLFLFMGKMGAAVVALALQATVIGWIPATIWALIAFKNMRKSQKANLQSSKSTKKPAKL